jgi:mannose-1-phosphate guanylyltransferase
MTSAILLVGGRGTRLSPITDEIPKPMLPIAGLPVTEHQIIAAKRAGVKTLVLATSYLAEVFTPYFGDGSKWGVNLRYAVEKEPLGTGGAISHAAQSLDSEKSEDLVLIFNGDVISDHDISAQILSHQKNRADVTLHLIQVEDARAFGCVPTADDGRVIEFLEKMEHPVTNWINAGCYVFNRAVVDSIPLGVVTSVERETFPGLIQAEQRVFGYKENAYWLDIGSPRALFKASRDRIQGDFVTNPTSLIDSTATLIGGTSVGANATIQAGVILENCIVSEGAVVAEGAHLSRCFVAPGAIVEPHLTLTDQYVARDKRVPINFI